MTFARLVCLLAASTSLAQAPVRVADLLTMGSGLRSTDTYQFAALGSRAVFVAKHPATGVELWVTDGTGAGTQLVVDLNPGPASSGPGSPVAMGGAVYFVASDGSVNRLFRTDGTAAGTQVVAPLACNILFPSGSLLFCPTSTELWVTDGTPGGTRMIQSIFGNGSVYEFASVGASTFYKGADGELWKSDGTMAGTARVRDLRPSNSTGSIHGGLVRLGSRVFFAADDGVSGLELWSSDGTSAGTTLVRDIVAGTAGSIAEGITVPPKLWATTTKVFFLGNTSAGIELWSSDGTSMGTAIVSDLTPTGSTFTATSELAVFQDQLFFPGADGELWKSDGTSTGTVQVKDVLPGATRAFPHGFFAAGPFLFFIARSASGFDELWRTDGTTNGTLQVKPAAQMRPNAPLGSVGTRALFTGNDMVVGSEPWISDGTPAGTQLLADLNAGPDYANSSPHALAKLGTSLLFVGRTTAGPLNLYRVDGTAAAQVLRSGLSEVNTIVSNGARAWFVSQRNQLWTTDGTVAGTVMLKQFATMTFDASATALTLVGPSLAFAANDAASGWELWASDGTVAGTRLVKDLVPGTMGSGPYSLNVLGGALTFLTAPTTGSVLWTSDLTANGTVQLKDYAPEHLSASVVAGPTLFGFASTKNKLWTSDGTAAGSTGVVDIGGAAFEVKRLDALGSRVVLRVRDPNGTGFTDDEAELWVSDGTVAGTQLLQVLGAPWQTFTTTEWSTLDAATIGTRLVFPFAARGGSTDLWVTDGTPGGTTALRDLFGGDRSDVALNVSFGTAGGLLYFAASDGVSGTELWKTDGTSAGTTRVADSIPGAGSSSPANFTLAEPNLYFSAFDASGDEELWKLDLALDNTPPVIRPMVSGTMGQGGWYTSNVSVTFQVTDPESTVSTMMGCGSTSVTADTAGVTFTCTATSRGGTSTATVTLKRDATPPVLTCPAAQTLEATASSGATVTFPLATAMDALTSASVVDASYTSGSTFTLGDADVVFSARDEAGNVGRCMTRISVVDTTPPVLQCPTNQSAKETAPGSVVLRSRATATDLVDAAPVVTQSVADGAALPVGLTRVLANALDASGNQSTCEFAITVEAADEMMQAPALPISCGCQGSGGGLMPLLLLALVVVQRRRRRVAA